MMLHEVGSVPRGRWKFEKTNWKKVHEAGRGSREALTTLCTIYWHPIYAFYRWDRNAEDALDLTQGFFARLLEKGDVAAADETCGRFRNWLLEAARSYRANDNKRKQAEKRGGGIPHFSIDAAEAEERYRMERDHREWAGDLSAEHSYDRRWARTLLERVLHRLGDEYGKRRQQPLFEELSRCLIGDNEQKYREMAQKLGMEEGNFRVQVSRSRARYVELLAGEVAQTVGTDDDFKMELRYLREVFRAR